MARGSRSISRGFTLIEMIATMVVISILAAFASRIIFAASDSFASANTNSLLTAQLSAAMERAAGALREIPAQAASSPAVPNITNVTSSSIAWGTTGQLNQSGAAINFTPNGGTAEVLIASDATLTITALNESGAALGLPLSGAACDAIHTVRMEMRIVRHGVTSRLRTSVFLHNLASGMAP